MVGLALLPEALDEETDGRVPEVGLTAAAAMVGHSAMDGTAVAPPVVADDVADGFDTHTITSLFADAAALLSGYLGLFGGALLHLAAAEILPEAHHEHPARSTVLCTIAGAAFIWLVVGIAE